MSPALRDNSLPVVAGRTAELSGEKHCIGIKRVPHERTGLPLMPDHECLGNESSTAPRRVA